MQDLSGPEHALALGTRTRSGGFRLELGTQRWWWSDEVYAIHGFAPHEVVPTTELLLAHKHPEDRDRVVATLDAASRTGAPFSSVHRIVDARGRVRVVAVVGEGQGPVADQTPTALYGYFTDVTDVVDDRAQAAASVAIAAAAQSRAVIDQAVGVVGFALSRDTGSAFAVLRAASNDANVPLRVLARAIVGALPTLRHDPSRVSHFIEGLLAPNHRSAPDA